MSGFRTFMKIVAFISISIFYSAVYGVDIYDCSIIAAWKAAPNYYKAGDLVDDGKKVYKCKNWPYTPWAGDYAHEPGRGVAWKDAWNEAGMCKQGTMAVDCDKLSPWQVRRYLAGDMVTENNMIFKCKGWPYMDWCGAAYAYKPLAGSSWREAWDQAGNCNMYYMSATATSHGIIVPAGDFTVNGGTAQKFYMFPDPNSSLIDVIVNGNRVGAPAIYTFNNINSNNVIHAVFRNQTEPKITAVCIFDWVNMAIKDDSTLWAWGGNFHEKDFFLGNGDSCGSVMPVQVAGENGVGYLTEVVSMTAGNTSFFAVTADGSVYGWRFSFNGELGMGDGKLVLACPKRVHGGAQGGNYLTRVQSIASTFHSHHALALLKTGEVVAWGINGDGQLGDGTDSTRWEPVYVKNPGGTGRLSNIVGIGCGGSFSVALDADGRVYQWGIINNSKIPREVLFHDGTFLTGIRSISVNPEHCLALTTDGRIYAWGENQNGECGNGDTSTALIVHPVLVKKDAQQPFDSAVAVIAGLHSSMAIKSDGTIRAWGILGITAGEHRAALPVNVIGDDGLPVTRVISAATNGSYDFYCKSDGALYGAGSNVTFTFGNATHISKICHPVKMDFSIVGKAPTALVPYTIDTICPAMVTIRASNSIPGDGKIISYTWWGDTCYSVLKAAGDTFKPYCSSGRYRYLLVVIDDNGAVDYARVEIRCIP